ncbi:MAG: hypothetical protein AAF667_14300 [Pseudomonadota bacterium]
MALPLAPIAITALRVAPIAVAAYAAWRSLPEGRRDQHVEDVIDAMPEGMTRHRDADAARATARFRRSVRLGRRGPGLEFDLAALGRLSIRRI